MGGVIQRCESAMVRFSVETPSSRDPSKMYTIKGLVRSGAVECSCPGFRFNGRCRHLDSIVETCGWDEGESREVQTQKQKTNHVCPRCGGKTKDTFRGDF